MSITKTLIIAFSFIATLLSAQTNTQIWKAVNVSTLERYERTERDIIPQKAFVFELDIARFIQQLKNTPNRFEHYNESDLPIISLPMPDASTKFFNVLEAPFFHPELQRKYPNIQSYVGYEVGNKNVTVRFDVSLGILSAMVFNGEKVIFIDAYSEKSNRFYNSYEKEDFKDDKRFYCNLEHDNFSDYNIMDNSERSILTGDGFLRKYRLALACTGEYAKYHGGTIPKVLAAMNKTMTRVNGVYEKEFALTMELIPNDTLLIFLNSVTDGYTNNSGSTMLGENQSKCDKIIGANNYDIGHVFSTGGGGIANLQSPCKNGSKAKGVTGLAAPKGDPFDIDYVCHEMGHQYGGTHTFNNECRSDPNNANSINRSNESSYEPGSGSTIMAYAGVCSPNVQSNSHAYFHAISISQINNYTVNSTGNSCPQKIATSNQNAPVVNAGANYTIPKETPFELLGIASDVETAAANLTYVWEQYDREIATMAPTGTATGGPLFRSIQPSNSPLRIFPQIANIVKNTKNTWEVLPKVARNMNFRLTVRDNDSNGGRSSVDAMSITVADAAAFKVTHPDTSKIIFTGGQYYDIKWDASTTNAAPINTNQVMILLSTDGGYTYPDTLAKAVSNNGLASIKMPEINTKTARIKIKGVNNIFFDISNNNFEIQKPIIPSFLFTATNTSASICKSNKDSVTFTINVENIAGFKQVVKLSADNLPNNLKVTFSQDTITPVGKVQVIFYNLKNTTSGEYAISINGRSNTLTDVETFNLSIYAPLSGKITPIKPLEFERGFGANSPFSWNTIKEAQKYTIEFSQNADFSTIVETGTTTDTTYIAQKLQQSQLYYWRVKAINTCNESELFAPIIFQTSELLCDTTSNNTELGIPATISEITSKIEITRKGLLADLDVYMKIDHTYFSDLAVSIVSPNGDDLTLFNGICTDKDNGDVTLDDAAGVLTCSPLGTATLKGRYRPQEPLSSFNYKSIKGVWTLKINDNRETNEGILRTWNMRVCTNIIPDENFLVETDILNINEGEGKTIDDGYLVATSGKSTVSTSQIIFKLLKLPKFGTLKKGNVVLTVGSTITQQEVITGKLSYIANTNIGAQKDTFFFETTNTAGGWIPNTPFAINIRENNLKFNADIQTIKCFGDANGKITINVTSGKEPIVYRIDNGNYVTSNVFDQLKAGDYTIEARDADGFVTTASITLVEPNKLVAEAKLDKNNVTISITGGTSPYLINYDNQGFMNINTFANQTNGVHTYIIKDANGCTLSDSFKVLYSTLTVTSQQKQPKCAGDANGSITIIATDGKSPYEYQINGSNYQQNNVFDNLGAGIYTINVKDSEGFIKTLNITLSQPEPLVFTINPKQDSITLAATGGTMPYQFSLDNGVTLQSSPLFTQVANGNYIFYVKDANDCIVTNNYQFISIKETLETLGITIFPNPADDFINIKLAKNLNLDIQICNAIGQVVINSTIKQGETQQTIDVSSLNNGIYQVILKSDSFFVSNKLLIQK